MAELLQWQSDSDSPSQFQLESPPKVLYVANVFPGETMNSSERKIFLVGPNRLQLELLSHFISEKTKLRCQPVPDLAAVPCSAATRHLTLYDCKTWKQCQRAGGQNGIKYQFQHNYVVLVNVEQSLGIESEALSQGVRGFLYDHDGCEILLKMINAVFESELWVSRNVMTDYIQGSARKGVQSNNRLGLTSREIDVLMSITRGSSNETIAETLCISPHTVKTHIYRIFKKINVSSRLQAANWTAQHLYP